MEKILNKKVEFVDISKLRENDKIYLICKNKSVVNNNDKCVICYKNTFSRNMFLKNYSNLICIETLDDYNYTKFVLKIIKKFLKEIGNKECLKIYIIENGNKYLNDLKQGIIALTKNIPERNEYIYEYIYDYIDKNYNINMCDFKDDICLANRKRGKCDRTAGCCYSFQYSKWYESTLIKNVKICEHLKNKRCQEKNLSCKLFTCKYLKKYKNIEFDTHEILLLDFFFNNKQHLILKYNFFKTKKEILSKLLEKNSLPFLIYYSSMRYLIK